MVLFSYRSVYDILYKIRHRDNDIAISSVDGRSLTYGRLKRHVTETIATLNSMGYGRNDRIVVVLPNGPEMAVAVISIAAGFTIVPLNPAYSQAEFEEYITLIKPQAVIVQEGVDSPAREVARSLHRPIIELKPMINEGAGLFQLYGEKGPGTAMPGFAEAEDNAFILLTSGTTARSKLNATKQYDLSQLNLFKIIMVKTGGKCLNIMPLFHANGISSIFMVLSLKGCFVSTPGFSAPYFFEWAEKFQPMWINAVPAMYQALLNESDKDPSHTLPRSIIRAYSSGAAMPAWVSEAFENKFGIRITSLYGMTEIASITVEPLLFYKHKPGSSGKLNRNIQTVIVDDMNHILPHGSTGEIIVRRARGIDGYVDDPEANSNAFFKGWFRTGDLGYVDEDNYLFITGRVKEMINYGGEKIVPGEIEAVLYKHPAVGEAVVFPIRSDTMGEEVGAAVVLRNGQAATVEELKQFVRDNLAYFKVPSNMVIVNEIPKSAIGKYQRSTLAEKIGISITAKPNSGTEQAQRPMNDHEKRLQALWEKVLETSPVHVDDNFFDLGGNSLQAAELMMEIENEFNVKLPLSIILNSPTIEQLALLIRNDEATNIWSPIVPIRTTGDKQNLFIIHTIGAQLIEYDPLIKQLGSEISIYGIQPKGLNGIEKPLSTLEEMAAYYITAIRSVQPTGPYNLLGFSAAGTLAYEIARQLHASGEKTNFLGIIDNPAPQSDFGNLTKSLDHKFVSILLREAPHLIKTYIILSNTNKLKVMRLTMNNILGKTIGKINFTSDHQHLDKMPVWINELISSAPVPRREVILANLEAINKYVPGIYTGNVILFVAFSDNNRSYLYKLYDTRMGWGKLVKGGVTRVIINGNHLGIMQIPGVVELAKQIVYYLDHPSNIDRAHITDANIFLNKSSREKFVLENLR